MRKKFELLSQWFHSFMFRLKVKFFDFLVSKNLIVFHNLHKREYSNDGVCSPVVEEDVNTSRYSIQISRVERIVKNIHEVWYENLSGKKLFVLDDSSSEMAEVEYRIMLTRFVAHFSRKNIVSISIPNNGFSTRVIIPDKPTSFSPLSRPDAPCETVSEKSVDVNFLKYRFALRETLDLEHFNNPEYKKDFLLFTRSKIVLMMDAKVEEINEDITGVKDPDTIVYRKGWVLAKPYVCPMCNFPVFKRTDGKIIKDFRCVNHGLLREPKYLGSQEYENMLDRCYDELVYRSKYQI